MIHQDYTIEWILPRTGRSGRVRGKFSRQEAVNRAHRMNQVYHNAIYRARPL